MATVSSLGVGSNLDLTTLLANIKSGEQAPLLALQKQQATYDAKLSAYGQLSSALSALQDASTALAESDLYQAVKATSSASDVLTASAATGAASGNYSVSVTALAQAQSLVTVGTADSKAAIGTGTLTFKFGSITGGAFVADDTRTADVIIESGDGTLEGIRDAINKDSSLGVTASIVNDGSSSPYRLVLTSKQSGEASVMSIDVTGNVAGDMALYDLLENVPFGAQNLEQTVAAKNAKLTVNGIAITSTSNSVVDAIQGVTLSMSQLGTSNVSVRSDTENMQSAFTTFVNAYNSLQTVVSKLTAFDAKSKTGAALLGDSTLRNIQVRIRSILNSAQATNSSSLTMMSQVGVSFQKDGTLAIDSTKLGTAFGSQLSGIATLFAGTGGVGGYGTQMAALISGFIGAEGTLSTATEGINTTLASLGKQYDATSERIDARVARYKAQFTALDQLMSSMNATSSYLTQQFDAMNNTSKN